MDDLFLPETWQNNNLYVFFDTKPPKKSEGSDNPLLTILVYKETFSEENKSFLNKILQALNLQIDTHITIYEYEKKDYVNVPNFDTQVVWWLGIDPKNAGWQVNWKNYRPYEFRNAIHLVSDHLTDLENNVQFKKSLWNILKQLF